MKKALMVTAVAGVVFPLAACGGSKQPAAQLGSPATGVTSTSASSSTPSAASSSTATPSLTSASSSATGTSGLPDLTLPSDVTLQFNLPKTTDSTQAAGLQGLVLAEQAKYKATETGTVTGPLVNDFFINDANQQIDTYLVHKQGNDTTVTGTNVYYDWKFPQEIPNKGVQITYCEDQNKFLAKDRKTGQSIPQESGLGQILGLKVNMVVDTDGRWKAGTYTWTAGDKTCQAAEGH
jgi:hypothetical protein